MKKLDSVHIVRLAQIMTIAYLVFVLLSDIMKWQMVDNTYMILAICVIAITSGSLRKKGGEKEHNGNK